MCCGVVGDAVGFKKFPIEQSDLRIPSKKSTFSTGCTDRIARSKKFLKPTASLNTPENTQYAQQQLRCWLDSYCCCCCCCSQRVSVANPVLRPPAARIVIRWQQGVLSMTFFFATPLLLLLLLLLLCSLWRFSTKSNATTATMKRMRAPRAPNERFARGKGATKTCA